MSEHLTNTPHATATMLEITPVTLRRWCEYHAAYLSAGANPPSGKARRFTGRDLEVFKHVRSLRAQGLTVADINEQLSNITFAVVDNSEQSAGDSEELAPTAAQAGLQQTPGPIMAPEYFMSIERRFEALEAARQEDRDKRIDTVTAIGLGFASGLLFCAILIGLAWLYGGNP
jgi:DNA-binding transcriptional MerR regulator